MSGLAAKVKDNLTLVVMAFMLMTSVGGYFGIKNIKPVWATQYDSDEVDRLQRYLWLLRRDERHAMTLLYMLDRAQKESGSTPDTVELMVKLTQELEWTRKGIDQTELRIRKKRGDE